MTYVILGTNDLQGDPQVNGYAAPGPPAEGNVFASSVYASNGLSTQVQIGNVGGIAGIQFGGDVSITRLSSGAIESSVSLVSLGHVYSEFGTAGQVEVGAVGPSGQAGAIFGVGGLTSNLYLNSNGVLRSDGGLNLGASAIAQQGLAGQVQVGNSSATPGIVFGQAGNTSNLYLNSNGVLRSDGGLILSGGTFLTNGGTSNVLSFFGAGGAGKQTVTGSKGANVALASLLTALSAHGLITDTTT